MANESAFIAARYIKNVSTSGKETSKTHPTQTDRQESRPRGLARRPLKIIANSREARMPA
jgi:hypothetical protein